MSDGDHLLGQPTAESERSLFDGIMGEQPGAPEGERHEERGEAEGGEREQPERREAEPPQRERDETGQFAKREDSRGDRHQVPVSALKDERGRRQAAETEREASNRREREANDRSTALERQLGEMRAQMEVLIRQGGQQRPADGQRQPEPEQAPDMYTQPDEYRAYIVRQAAAEASRGYEAREVARVDYSLGAARQRDSRAYDDAVSALRAMGPQAVAQMQQQLRIVPDAGSHLLDWNKRRLAQAEIGSDPVAYRERLRADLLDPQKLMQDPAIVQALTDHLRQQAGQGGANGGPRTAYTPMPSLNGARGGNARAEQPDAWDNSDRGVFRAAMDGPRRG